ncbi:MAG TPA: DEAD/DEAH box helicase [Thermodesulfobacteriota bacterium]|jgi:superfamily II DNA or RNA helicase|nr:DEAD/DEAH box helicase [Thermodesulfobacteriota bacterium]
MIIILSNHGEIQGGSASFKSEIRNRLTIENPVWIENERLGRWNGNTPRLLHFYEDTPSGLILPRGFFPQLISMTRRFGETFQIEDRRRVLPEVDFQFRGQLRIFQEEAVKAILRRDMGTLAAPPGSGKTVMALYLVSQRRQPALIIVHTKELLNQWANRIEQFLGISSSEVGRIGDGERRVGEKISVALVQSLYKCASEVFCHIGYLIVDECHRTPSRTFTEAVSAFDSKFITGLSATPWRRDRLSKLIYWYVGDVVHQANGEDLVETGNVLRAEVIIRETRFQPASNPSTEYSRMLSELTEDPARNRLISGDVAEEARNGGGICLVLSDRKAHCHALRNLLLQLNVQSEVLTGDLSDEDRKLIVNGLNAGQVKVVIATGQLIGEGFDCKNLSTLFLTTPIRFDGRLIQYLGRVLRPAPGKEKARVYDYVDPVRVLQVAAAARGRVYAA